MEEMWIRQLARWGVQNPVCSLIRDKGGISLYRVKAEGRAYVLKLFEKAEDTREIENYRLLADLGIPTLPLLKADEKAILLPDVEADPRYRLGVAQDMSDVQVAGAVAKWYKELHNKGRAYLSGRKTLLYDESDVITETNMEFVAEKTNTKENGLWKAMADRFTLIRDKIDALPRTLTYNDFYWTNLIVAKDKESAFMFDYNLLGKGIAYGDIRNVTSSLSEEAGAAFCKEYGVEGIAEEAVADRVLSPLVTLYFACEQQEFPDWAGQSLAELKNGDILTYMNNWLKG